MFDPNSSESHGFSAASHEVTGHDVMNGLGHRHADLEIHCWDQEVEFLLAGRTLILPANVPVLIWAGNPHQLLRPVDHELRHISWITLPIAWLREWNLSPDLIRELLNGHAFHLSKGEGWETRLPEWVELIQSGGDGQKIARLEIEAMLYRMQRDHHVLDARSPGAELPLAVEKALVWLLAHFKEAETAQHVAKALGYNPKYLMTVFKQHVGQTLHRYLNQLRIMEAQRLLIQTDLPVTQIALDSGFQSLGRFYVAFLETYGQTPRSFRKRFLTSSFREED